MADNTSEHVAAAGTDSNTKFKSLEELSENLIKVLSNFKTVMEFQNKDFNADKPHQYEEVRKEIVKINERYLDQFLCLCFLVIKMIMMRKLDCLKNNEYCQMRKSNLDTSVLWKKSKS